VRLAPFPEPAEELYGATVNGKMYVLGGYGERIGKVFEYDPASDRWTKKKTMQVPVHHQAMVPYNGKLYVIGGRIGHAFVTVSNLWSAMLSMPMPRHGVAGAVIGNRFHLVSGQITSAPAGGGLDPGLSLYTGLHDAIDLPR